MKSIVIGGIVLALLVLSSCDEFTGAELMDTICEDAKQKNEWGTMLYCLVNNPNNGGSGNDGDEEVNPNVIPPNSEKCNTPTEEWRDGNCACKDSNALQGEARCYASMTEFFKIEGRKECDILQREVDKDFCYSQTAPDAFACSLHIKDPGILQSCIKKHAKDPEDCIRIKNDQIQDICIERLELTWEGCDSYEEELPYFAAKCKSFADKKKQDAQSTIPQISPGARCVTMEADVHRCILEEGRGVEDCEFEVDSGTYDENSKAKEECIRAFTDCSFWKNWVEPTFQSEKCKFQNLPKIFDSCRQLRLPEWHDKCMLLQARSQGECLEIFDSKLKSSCIAAFVS